MAVYLPCYATREDIKSATDILASADYNAHIDSAIQSAVDDINGLCHRRFYNVDETNKVDWPNYQRAYPWRVWLEDHELADVTVNQPVVTSGGNSIPDSAIFFGPWQSGVAPPYTFFELDRSQSYSFGQGSTPQQDISISGTFGYWRKSRPAGSLAAAVSSTSAVTVTVSDASVMGVGDTLTVDSERLLVSERAYVTTGQTQVGSGCSTVSAADNVLQVADGTQLHIGELLQLDAEVMKCLSVTGNLATVKRSYDGTVLATHSGATVYAARLLTVLRGQFGTTAATHLINANLTALVYPPEVHELAIAESLNYVAQKTAAYARSIGENATPVPGGGLPDLRARCYQRRGRKMRRRVV